MNAMPVNEPLNGNDDPDAPLWLYDDTNETQKTPATTNDKQPGPPPWTVLIVDDDADVHEATSIVLHNFRFEERPLRLVHAMSEAEARVELARLPDIAVILLDVVMESDTSGLKLVRHIRDELRNHNSRIILRTGQPGSAPEERVILEYDINDYKEKSELTRQKLVTAVAAALRSYQQIDTIERSRKELHNIILASTQIFKIRSIHEFLRSVLQQFAYLLHIDTPIMNLAVRGMAGTASNQNFTVLASIGDDQPPTSAQAAELPEGLLEELRAVMAEGRSQYRKKWYIACFLNPSGTSTFFCLECRGQISPLVLDLIELFNMDVSIACNNLYLNQEITETQIEMIYALGNVVETRSQETSNHVQRVSSYAALLATSLGLTDEEVQTLGTASIMHDVGKLGIPDHILLKPGPLDQDERRIMQRHTLIGHEVLAKSSRPILRAAAVIAMHHHERWDGSGYPQGLAGEAIPLSARITAIADVFDALTSDRVYHKAWPVDEVLAHLREEAGKGFDPNLVAAFLKQEAAIRAILATPSSGSHHEAALW